MQPLAKHQKVQFRFAQMLKKNKSGAWPWAVDYRPIHSLHGVDSVGYFVGLGPND